MALTRKAAQPGSWQPQAEHFAVAHTARTAMPPAEQARRRPLLKRVTCQFRSLSVKFEHRPGTSKIELGHEIKQTRAKLAKLEKQAPRTPTAARVLYAHVKTRAAQVAAANKRITELGDEVGSAREELVRLENENSSLRTSLGLIFSENERLSHSLRESDAAVDKARSQFEQKQTALTVAEAECNKLASAVDEQNKKRATEATTPNTRPEAMSSDVIAEAEAWLSLLARTERKNAAKRKVADATVARNAADKKLELVYNSLQVKKREFQVLEQSYSKLVEGMRTLLKIFKMREAALARAEDSIEFLAERVAQLEVEANLAKSQQTIEKLNPQRQCELMERSVADVTRDRPRMNWAELLQELDNYVRDNSRHSERIRVRASETLLADTIAF